MKIDLKNINKGALFHFVGIGGIGMSAIAGAMQSWGFRVQGSNDVENENMAGLADAGVRTFVGHAAGNVRGADYIVFSSAVPLDNIELAAARSLGLPVVERAEMLDSIMLMKKGIAVAGTHGKTTTTSFIGTLLDSAGLSPTIIDGGIMNYYRSHHKIGAGEFVVAEACEAFGNLAHFTPAIAVVTNVDAEHLDYYKTFAGLERAFRDFASKVPDDGLFVACADHPVANGLALGLKRERGPKWSGTVVTTYGFGDADITAYGLRRDGGGVLFDARVKDYGDIKDIRIPLAGRHNVLNSLAALAVARFLRIGDDAIRGAFAKFQGVRHRFTLVGGARGAYVYDDYGHHPKEIETTLAMAREVAGGGRVFALWEPHRYSRLTGLFDDFGECFVGAEKTLVLPVYAADETCGEGMRTKAEIVAAIAKNSPVADVESLAAAADVLKAELESGDLVVSFSAGDLKNQMSALPAMLDG
jgi:UDP-N-acetylmuramate--alanine ligase